MLSLFKIAALGAACLLLAGFWFINRDEMDPLMTPERRARIEASPHYRTGNSGLTCPMKRWRRICPSGSPSFSPPPASIFRRNLCGMKRRT